MSFSSAGQRYVIKVLGQQFNLTAAKVEESLLKEESTYVTISDFLKGEERASKLLFFYQSRDSYTEEGDLVEAPDGAPAELYLCAGEVERQKAPAVFFTKNGDKVGGLTRRFKLSAPLDLHPQQCPTFAT